MADDNQAFRPLSPEQEALAHEFFTEYLLPFGRRLGDPPEVPTCCDVMVHPMLDFLAASLVDSMLSEDIEDIDAAMAIAQKWADALQMIFLSYTRQHAEREWG